MAKRTTSLPEENQENTEQKQITDTNSMIDENIMKDLASDGARTIIDKISIPTLYSKEQVQIIIDKLAQYKNVTTSAITVALGEFFRQGGANANISPLKRIRLICPDSGVDNYLYAQEIQSILISQQWEIKPSLRTLAESMAPSMLRGLLLSHEKNPSFVPEGDLAKVLDKDLLKQKGEPLTAKERIGAAIYYQWMPDLNKLVDSTRLKTLLLTNLKNKKEQQRQKAQKQKQKEKQKVEKNSQPAKGRKGKKNMANNIRKRSM